MQIFVRNSSSGGLLFPLEVSGSDTIASVKSKIHAREQGGIPPDQQRLSHAFCSDLSDDRTLDDCNIQQHSTLQLTRRVAFGSAESGPSGGGVTSRITEGAPSTGGNDETRPQQQASVATASAVQPLLGNVGTVNLRTPGPSTPSSSSSLMRMSAPMTAMFRQHSPAATLRQHPPPGMFRPAALCPRGCTLCTTLSEALAQRVSLNDNIGVCDRCRRSTPLGDILSCQHDSVVCRACASSSSRSTSSYSHSYNINNRSSSNRSNNRSSSSYSYNRSSSNNNPASLMGASAVLRRTNEHRRQQQKPQEREPRHDDAELDDKNLVCPVCLQPCAPAFTFPACMHRVCGTCAPKLGEEALSAPGKKCPTCRKVSQPVKDAIFTSVVENAISVAKRAQLRLQQREAASASSSPSPQCAAVVAVGRFGDAAAHDGVAATSMAMTPTTQADFERLLHSQQQQIAELKRTVARLESEPQQQQQQQHHRQHDHHHQRQQQEHQQQLQDEARTLLVDSGRVRLGDFEQTRLFTHPDKWDNRTCPYHLPLRGRACKHGEGCHKAHRKHPVVLRRLRGLQLSESQVQDAYALCKVLFHRHFASSRDALVRAAISNAETPTGEAVLQALSSLHPLDSDADTRDRVRTALQHLERAEILSTWDDFSGTIRVRQHREFDPTQSE